MQKQNLPIKMRPERVSAIADTIVQRGYGVPALFFLEAYKPLTSVWHALFQVSLPMVEIALGRARTGELICLLESRENIELLLRAIEEKEIKKNKGVHCANP